MAKYIFSRAKPVWLLLFLLVWPFYGFANNLVRITSGEWPPYLSESLPYGGFAQHIITEAFFEMGYDIDVEHYPWKRSYQYALNGRDQHGDIWHGTMIWVQTPEREKAFFYSDAVVIDDEVLFYLKDRPLDWQTIDDLQGMVLGGTAHTAYPLFEQAEQDGIITLQRGGNYDTLLKRLFLQKIDATPLVKHVGNYYLNECFTPEEQTLFAYSPRIIETRYYHLILTKALKENRQLIETFNEGLRKLHQSGRYQQLLRDLRRGKYQLSTKQP